MDPNKANAHDNNPYYVGVSAAVSAILAWNLFVYTIEVNDFRHRLKNAYLHPPPPNHNKSGDTHDANDGEPPPPSPPSTPLLSTKRYIAALVATRLGLRDALMDWFTIYIILWAIVGGITYYDADPNSLLVLWGINAMISALIVANTSLKAIQWLGLYRASQFQIVKDTSGLAPGAVKNLLGGGGSSTLTTYRYQVRLAVGKHFGKFALLLLPFYVGLRAGWFLASLLIGILAGHLFLYCVFKVRQHFDTGKQNGKGAIGASIFLSLVASLLFGWGMLIVDVLWVSRSLYFCPLLLLCLYFFTCSIVY